ncbi:YheU family protein [Salinibius halmophilus]|uniref:YheU family protein n=1 Tax=Salinibius halmophilus TaxID=1853216 RepID=UPI001314F2F9|nr:YheU family protein [Salinibius halmophilus]
MIIPVSALEPATLRNLIENFVTSGASDIEHLDWTLEDKVQHVERGLRAGSLYIVFDEASESCTILTLDQWQEMNK